MFAAAAAGAESMPGMPQLVRCPSCGKSNRVRAVARGTPRCAVCKTALPWITAAGDADVDAETTASVPVLLDLWAPWCGPCRMVTPALERLAERHASRLKLVKVNVDEAPQTARRFGAMSIPTLVLLRDGRQVDRVVGALPEPQLARWLDGHLAGAAAGEP